MRLGEFREVPGSNGRQKWATAVTYNVDTPGPCTGNLASLPWKHLKRPIYPLDPISQPEFKFS